MKTRLSGMMDGELEATEAGSLFDAMKREHFLRQCWSEYQVIGDALRGEGTFDQDITARVMAGVRQEPVVLAPRAAAKRRDWRSSALALAATVAGVGVVGWIALTPQSGHLAPSAQLAFQQRAKAEILPVKQASRSMQEYLVAHQTQTASLQFRSGTQQIRTVAALGSGTGK